MTANPVDVYVGARLKIRRNELGLSQNKIGELTGVTFQQIQKYEKGSNRIGSSRLYEFAKILKVPVSYFFDQYEVAYGDKGYLSDSKTNFDDKNAVSEKEVIALIKNFSSIKDPELRKSITNLAKTLSKKGEEENSEK
ncbi:MAG TPA: helix-turn-helix transcriptional regulator [Rickettsiales bacterium]|nr:helix-turn-helix transcriptional regulator [Rickettsiales bacterium]